MLRDLCRGQLGYGSRSPHATVNTPDMSFQRQESSLRAHRWTNLQLQCAAIYMTYTSHLLCYESISHCTNELLPYGQWSTGAGLGCR